MIKILIKTKMLKMLCNIAIWFWVLLIFWTNGASALEAGCWPRNQLLEEINKRNLVPAVVYYLESTTKKVSILGDDPATIPEIEKKIIKLSDKQWLENVANSLRKEGKSEVDISDTIQKVIQRNDIRKSALALEKRNNSQLFYKQTLVVLRDNPRNGYLINKQDSSDKLCVVAKLFGVELYSNDSLNPAALEPYAKKKMFNFDAKVKPIIKMISQQLNLNPVYRAYIESLQSESYEGCDSCLQYIVGKPDGSDFQIYPFNSDGEIIEAGHRPIPLPNSESVPLGLNILVKTSDSSN